MQFEIELRGTERLSRFSYRWPGILERSAEALGLTLENITVERFNTKIGPDGPWAPWAPSTAAGKPPGHSLMVASSNLRLRITHSVSGLEITVGTPVHYAKFHQYGTKKMPARKIFGISESETDILTRKVEYFVNEALDAF